MHKAIFFNDITYGIDLIFSPSETNMTSAVNPFLKPRETRAKLPRRSLIMGCNESKKKF